MPKELAASVLGSTTSHQIIPHVRRTLSMKVSIEINNSTVFVLHEFISQSTKNSRRMLLMKAEKNISMTSLDVNLGATSKSIQQQ